MEKLISYISTCAITHILIHFPKPSACTTKKISVISQIVSPSSSREAFQDSRFFIDKLLKQTLETAGDHRRKQQFLALDQTDPTVALAKLPDCNATIPSWKRWFSFDHRSQAKPGSVSTCMGDRPGIPGVASNIQTNTFALVLRMSLGCRAIHTTNLSISSKLSPFGSIRVRTLTSSTTTIT